MNVAERAELLIALQSRCHAIADSWQTALAQAGFVSLSTAQVRQRLTEWTGQVIACLLAEPFDSVQAEAIGASLASLQHVQPEALGQTLDVLARHLLEGLAPEKVLALQPDLVTLLSRLAAGFVRQVRDTILAEQAQIHTAFIAQHERASEALRESEARRRAQEMAELYETSLEINSQPDVSALLHAIIQRATRLLGVSRGELYLMDPDGKTLDTAIRHNLDDYAPLTLRPGEGIAGRVAQTGQPMMVEDYQHWEGRAPAYAHSSFGRVLGVPLKLRDRVIGVIVVQDDVPGVFTEPEIRLVSLFADQAAIALDNARLYQAEREHRELAETLREVNAALVSTLDMDLVLDRLLEQVRRVVPNDTANIMLVEGELARVARWRGYEQFGVEDPTSITLPVSGTASLRQMIATGEPVVIPDTETDPHWVRVPRLDWLRSYAGAPIRVRGETIGFLSVNSATPGFYGPFHAERLSAFANQAAIAIENARRYQAERDQRELAEALCEAGVALSATLDHNAVLDRLLDEIWQVVAYDTAHILLVEGKLVRVVRSRSDPHELYPSSPPVSQAAAAPDFCRGPLDIGDLPSLQWMAETRQPLVIPDTAAFRPGGPGIESPALGRSWAGAPIVVRGQIIAFFSLSKQEPNFYRPEHAERLASFAGQAALALQNAWLFQAEREQRELAETLRELGAALVATLDADLILDRLLANISRVVPNEAADIMLVEGHQARLARSRGYETLGVNGVAGRLAEIASLPYLRRMAQTGEPVVIPDVRSEPEWVCRPNLDWVRSYAGVPIRVRGGVIGFLSVLSGRPDFYGPPHAERLRAFADQVGIALENARLFQEAQNTAAQLQALSQRLVEVQEAERRHIARELHDEIGQILTAVKINLQAVQRSPSPSAHLLRETIGIVERALQQVRNLSLDLRPSLLDDLGLAPALRWYVDRQAQRAGFAAQFAADPLERRLSPELEIACFRVVQEALTNVMRHGQAQHVFVELRQHDSELELVVRDDGRGFDVAAALERAAHGGSLGLLGIQERVHLAGGQVQIESEPGYGAEVRARFPLTFRPSAGD